MEERRQLPRFEIKKDSKAWLPPTQVFSHCVIEDLHLKGMSVSFEKELPPIDPLKMSFTIGENFDFIKVEAQVRWEKDDQDRYVYGLSFSKILDEDKDKIDHFIQTNCFDQVKEKWWGK